MTITHHPSDDLLFDYATGTLGEAWSLAIATHLALCPSCRQEIARIEAIGGSLMEVTTPIAITDDAFDRLLEHIDEAAPDLEAPPLATPKSSTPPVLPEPLRRYAGGDIEHLNWQRLGLGASQLLLPMTETGVSARMLRIPAGRPVPTHSHGGLELTLVLSGAFSDATGHYGRGDLQEADSDLEHQPHATPETDCVCLAITDAPLKFKSLAARIAQPFLGI